MATVVPSTMYLYHAVLNLKKNFENKHASDDLHCLGQPSVVTSEKREAIAKNVMECHTTSSQKLVQQVGFPHTSTYHALRSIA